MRYLASALIVLATSLWLGGLVGLFICALAVFKISGLDHEAAGKATSAMFVAFGRCQLAVAALALIGAFLAYVSRRGTLNVVLFLLFALATLGAVCVNMLIIPRLEELRLAGKIKSPEFATWHHHSAHVMMGMTLILLIAAMLIPAVCRQIAAPPKPASPGAG